MATNDEVKRAENDLLESLNEPASYENDGEKITQFSPESKLEVIKQLKKSQIRNPFSCLKGIRITTGGPGK